MIFRWDFKVFVGRDALMQSLEALLVQGNSVCCEQDWGRWARVGFLES